MFYLDDLSVVVPYHDSMTVSMFSRSKLASLFFGIKWYFHTVC